MKYLSKEEVIDRFKHYRFIKNQLLEIIGGWVQSLPEVEIKIQSGRQLHSDAVHSDLLKQRLTYLGARTDNRQLAYPNKKFISYLEDVWHSSDQTVIKLYTIDVLIRSLVVDVIREQLDRTSVPEDKASEEILRRIVSDDYARISWANSAIVELDPRGEILNEKVKGTLKAKLAASGGFMASDDPGTPFKKAFPYSKHPVRPASWKIVEDADSYSEKNNSFDNIEGKRRLLHDLIDGELCSIERLGRMLAEFPDLPWEMKTQLAKQAWDESRHAEAQIRRLKEFGGNTGQYPVNYWGWEVDVNRPDPLERLAISNMTFESEACKHMSNWIETARATGDEESARLIEFILMDEVTHVQIGKRWVEELTKGDQEHYNRVVSYPETVLKTARPKGIKIDDLEER